VEGYFHGTGDVFGSALLSGLMNGQNLSLATETAVDYTQKAIVHTMELNQERRYGVCFEKVLPYLMEKLGLLK
jgi:pyridoxine kinase